MSEMVPEYYFRVRDNGAMVFRVDTTNRQRRIEMDPIAVANVRNGDIKPQGDRILSKDDKAAIEAWIAERRETLRARDLDDIQRAVDHLKLTAHWAQTKATDDDLEAFTDDILMAMHDLRTVLVRKKADRHLKK